MSSKVYDIYLTLQDVKNIEAAEEWLERQKEDPKDPSYLKAPVNEIVLTLQQQHLDPNIPGASYPSMTSTSRSSTPTLLVLTSTDSSNTLSSEHWRDMTPLSVDPTNFNGVFFDSYPPSRLNSRSASSESVMESTNKEKEHDQSHEEVTYTTVIETARATTDSHLMETD